MSKHNTPQLPKRASPRSGQPAEDRADRVQRLVSEGARLLGEKRPGEAALLLAKAWDLDPRNAAAAINLGGAYILQGRHARAIPILEAASRLEPENPMVWINLAAAYLGKLPLATQAHQERAIQAFEQALALDGRAPHVHYNLGLIYLERNDPAQAAAHFHQALEVDPNDRDARLWLERIRRGELEKKDLEG